MEPLTSEDPPVIGRYRLLARLGAGGMGRVYLARTATRRIVVKTIRSEIAGDPTFHARFAREVELARKVAGPYTAAVIDADPHASEPWLATEYIEGPSLQTAVTRTGGPLPESSLALLAAGLAEALVDIHRVGIVHRDLKPGNVLLAADAPRVIDFGIAKAVVENTLTPITAVGHVLGTPTYMAPEQILGRAAVPAGDVFSLGGVLYFAATGTSPFGAADQALFFRVLNTEPDLERVPERWRELIASCLVKEPEGRPGPEGILERIGDIDLDASGWPPPGVFGARTGSDTAGPAPSGSAPSAPVSSGSAPPPRAGGSVDAPPPVSSTSPVAGEESAGALSGADPAVPTYDALPPPSVRARLRELTIAQVRDLRAYEVAHLGRAEFIRMYDDRIAGSEAGGPDVFGGPVPPSVGAPGTAARGDGVPGTAAPGAGAGSASVSRWRRSRPPVAVGWYLGAAGYVIAAAVLGLYQPLWYTAALIPCVLVPPLLVLQQGLRTGRSPEKPTPPGSSVARVAAFLLALPLPLFALFAFANGDGEVQWAFDERSYHSLPLTLGLPLLLLLDPPPIGSPLRGPGWGTARPVLIGLYVLVLGTAFVFHRDEVANIHVLDHQQRLMWMAVLGVCATVVTVAALGVAAWTGGAPRSVVVPSAAALVSVLVLAGVTLAHVESDALWLVYGSPVPLALLATAAVTAAALVAAAVSRARVRSDGVQNSGE
ncbi:protein kinase [Nocardiopsis sp. N85]|uniref:protein kinase domain-containing protein n=1 Tax=Nocardiopsis sp. N85 TaxID=3029400 RepID=UPI00237F67A9|nr:protein kinase [Nocardiopsis sp. N85]MDE3721695.1 protein kinase [Nocardiopsis sp. N85]